MIIEQILELIIVTPHPFVGCNPLERGQPNATPDSRGSTAALFNLIAALRFHR